MTPYTFHGFAISLLSATLMMFSQSLGASLPALPAFIPNPPEKTKAVASYTAADVFSSVVVAGLPKDHPVEEFYAQGKAKLKTMWLGAKDPTQIDAMVNLILGATPPANKEDTKKALQGVRFILYFIMDLSDAAKADAIVRVAGQQTDPIKKKLVAEFAYEMFDDLYDPRLLQFIAEYVDDSEVIVFPPRAEGRARQRISVGALISGSMIQKLKEIGFEREALPPLTTDKAQTKSDFIAWFPAHMAEATQKCNAYKARPDFSVNPPRLISWSARP